MKKIVEQEKMGFYSLEGKVKEREGEEKWVKVGVKISLNKRRKNMKNYEIRGGEKK